MFIDFLRLVRFPLVLTVVSNLWLGFVAVRRGFAIPPVEVWLTGPCIYLGGMALNDWADIERDRALHPRRPLPSGRLPRSAALVIACVFFASSLVLAWLSTIGLVFGLAVATALLAAAYDLLLKRWTLPGSLALGACRGLNVLIGVAAAGGSVETWNAGTLVAAGIGGYGLGLTWVSTLEEMRTWAPRAVRAGLWGYFALDAAVAAALGLGPAALFPLGLAAPALLLDRWIGEKA